MVKPAAPKRHAPTRGPANQSRAAGAAAPASAAATAPMAGAHSADPASEFYRPEGGAPVSGLAALADAPPAAPHVAQTRANAVDAGHGASADVQLAPEFETGAAAEESLDEAIARIRQIRKPLGQYSQKLALTQRAGYHRHWFNDVADRVNEAEANGWSHVPGKDGQPTKRAVGSGREGGVLYAYAMEIPEVFWLEDMATKNQVARSRIDQLKAKPFASPPGAAKASDRGKFYDPHEETGAGPVQVVKV